MESLDIDDNKKSDQLILIIDDHKEIKYSIKKFSKMSKLFDDQINCESFNKFGNVKEDGSIEYSLPFDYKIVKFIIDEYYVENYFDTYADFIEYKKHKLDIIDKKFMVDIYMFSIYMNMIQLKFEMEQYILGKYMYHIWPIDGGKLMDSKKINMDIIYSDFDYLIKKIKMDVDLVRKIKSTNMNCSRRGDIVNWDSSSLHLKKLNMIILNYID